jgi:hypothetical protein
MAKGGMDLPEDACAHIRGLFYARFYQSKVQPDYIYIPEFINPQSIIIETDTWTGCGMAT